MLKDKTRNIIVGLTFIVAAVIFMMGIFFLGQLPELGPNAPYRVTVLTPDAGGVSTGDVVDLDGVTVGTVEAVALTPHYVNARVALSIYQKYSLPVNTVAQIGNRIFGTSFVKLVVPQPLATTNLSKNGLATVSGSLAGSDLIPKSFITDFTALKNNFSGLSVKLDRVTDDLHALLKPVALTAAQASGQNTLPPDMNNMSALTQRLNVTINSFNQLIANTRLQSQIRRILANAADSSAELKTILSRLNGTVTRANKTLATANTAAANVDLVAQSARRRIADISVHLTDLLEHLDAITKTIATGHGSAGRFIKDPRLYNALLDLTHKLKSTVNDMHALVKQIQANGVKLNVHF